jgi:TspO/MBR family
MKLSSQRSDPDLWRQLITAVAIVASILVNTISNIFPPNGINIGQISNTVFADVRVTPANYAFGIWGLIYLGLIALGIYQFQSTERGNPHLQKCGYLLTIACACQCAWIYLFLARQFPLSVVAMLGILLSLIGMYNRLGIGRERVSQAERWMVQIPISIYLSWIAVATIVNIASTLYSISENGWVLGSILWTIIMMAISAAIAASAFVHRQDTAFLLVTVWTLIAIAIRQIHEPIIVVSGAVMAISLVLLSLNSRSTPLSSAR